MECFENQDCVGWEKTKWDRTTGKVTNKFLNRETSYTDIVDREFAAMGIENWRDHITLVASKEAVDAELDKDLLMEAKVAAAARSGRHMDDDSADKSVWAASVISGMRSYDSISSNAKATAEQQLRTPTQKRHYRSSSTRWRQENE